MKKYNVINIQTGELVAVVEAPSSASARRGFPRCRAEEQKESLPEEAAYIKWLIWKNSFQSSKTDWNDQVGYGDDDRYIIAPECPLSDEEMKLAQKWARFINVKMV